MCLLITCQELLGVFSMKNKRLPEVLVMYRDGVSEGQFDEVGGCKMNRCLSKHPHWQTEQ